MENHHDSAVLRTRPRQARSRETFDNVLAAAGDMLIETGWEGFNTNALAERVGCRVATVYRYFPDKVAIVSTLAENIVAQWDKELLDFAESAEPGVDFRELWPQLVDRFIGILRRQPAAMAVRSAMQAEPTLRAIDQADNRRLAESVGRTLQKKLPHLAKMEANSAARTLIETTVAITDVALASPAKECSRLLRQLTIMQQAYLTRLYEDQGRRSK
ncbi:MAG: TetR/AcrR family transcriptional regulator [Pseudomonadota bacterium]